MKENATIIALSGKGGVGKTSISAAIVKLLVQNFPDKKILAIDADPAVGLSTALGIDVKMTIDDIRKEIVETVDKNILVQGVAGSGKTSVAMHRISYLIYRNNKIYNSKWSYCYL